MNLSAKNLRSHFCARMQQRYDVGYSPQDLDCLEEQSRKLVASGECVSTTSTRYLLLAVCPVRNTKIKLIYDSEWGCVVTALPRDISNPVEVALLTNEENEEVPSHLSKAQLAYLDKALSTSS